MATTLIFLSSLKGTDGNGPDRVECDRHSPRDSILSRPRTVGRSGRIVIQLARSPASRVRSTSGQLSAIRRDVIHFESRCDPGPDFRRPTRPRDRAGTSWSRPIRPRAGVSAIDQDRPKSGRARPQDVVLGSSPTQRTRSGGQAEALAGRLVERPDAACESRPPTRSPATRPPIAELGETGRDTGEAGRRSSRRSHRRDPGRPQSGRAPARHRGTRQDAGSAKWSQSSAKARSGSATRAGTRRRSAASDGVRWPRRSPDGPELVDLVVAENAAETAPDHRGGSSSTPCRARPPRRPRRPTVTDRSASRPRPGRSLRYRRNAISSIIGGPCSSMVSDAGCAKTTAGRMSRRRRGTTVPTHASLWT